MTGLKCQMIKKKVMLKKKQKNIGFSPQLLNRNNIHKCFHDNNKGNFAPVLASGPTPAQKPNMTQPETLQTLDAAPGFCDEAQVVWSKLF